ncbi:hypothetical protein WICMUC_005890 [Wickerhamomyces mucosus]|uniref:Uncharacterized protein n=1 Tax=Wickerhamomyces mucosus TaxID=1378264 RepID=A0A9P8P250_9ASCO|nr:hypothetical protein WICMUC_005890 [Wickerhamomyces mucosus]
MSFLTDEEREKEFSKIIELRDRLLSDTSKENDIRMKRLKLEKKIRNEYYEKSDYVVNLRHGRYDLINPDTLNHIYTPIKELNKAQYQVYKSRKQRETEDNQLQVEKNPEQPIDLHQENTITGNINPLNNIPYSNTSQSSNPTSVQQQLEQLTQLQQLIEIQKQHQKQLAQQQQVLFQHQQQQQQLQQQQQQHHHQEHQPQQLYHQPPPPGFQQSHSPIPYQIPTNNPQTAQQSFDYQTIYQLSQILNRAAPPINPPPPPPPLPQPHSSEISYPQETYYGNMYSMPIGQSDSYQNSNQQKNYDGNHNNSENNLPY